MRAVPLDYRGPLRRSYWSCAVRPPRDEILVVDDDADNRLGYVALLARCRLSRPRSLRRRQLPASRRASARRR